MAVAWQAQRSFGEPTARPSNIAYFSHIKFFAPPTIPSLSWVVNLCQIFMFCPWSGCKGSSGSYQSKETGLEIPEIKDKTRTGTLSKQFIGYRGLCVPVEETVQVQEQFNGKWEEPRSSRTKLESGFGIHGSVEYLSLRQPYTRRSIYTECLYIHKRHLWVQTRFVL